jgi:LysM repeat protein
VEAGTTADAGATTEAGATADAGTTTATPQPDTTEAPPAVAATTALAVTDTGVKVLQSGSKVPSDVTANVSLEVIAYPSPDRVQFGGHGTAGQFVRLYLDNAPLGDATLIPADGAWSASFAGIEPRIYTLRVDQVDGTGKVTSRFETPFKREIPAALAAASGITAPAAGTKVADAPATVPATEAANGSDVVASTSGKDTASTGSTTTVETAPPAASAADAPASLAADATSTAAPVPAGDSAVNTQTTPAKPAEPVTVTVQPGYTLWYIAKQNFGQGVLYVQVFEANRDKIRNPDLIYPGQVFTIPAKP